MSPTKFATINIVAIIAMQVAVEVESAASTLLIRYDPIPSMENTASITALPAIRDPRY